MTFLLFIVTPCPYLTENTMKPCRTCGDLFKPKSNNNIYCKKHAPKKFESRQNYNVRQRLKAKPCKFCSVSTLNKTGYCSELCKKLSNNFKKHTEESEGFHYNPCANNYVEHAMPVWANV